MGSVRFHLQRKGKVVKKLLISGLILGMIVLSGCAGDDDPAGPGDTLPTVQDLAIGNASAGRNIVLLWSEVQNVDGYKVYFRETSGGTWTEVGETSNTTFTHEATVAGFYSVRAYKGSNHSENYSSSVNTVPNIITTTYRIYDRWSPAHKHSGFIFGENSGQTGMAGDPNFRQDIYAWDEQTKGDMIVHLYSGTYGPYGNGYTTYLTDPALTGYGWCNPYPGGTWWENYPLNPNDQAVFCALEFSGGDYIYVKMYNLVISPDPDSPRGTEVAFSYEYQTMPNITVFTSNF